MAQPISVFVTRTTGGDAATRDGTAVAATVYSEPWSAAHADGFGAFIQWTGTPTGNLQLWATDKPQPDFTTDSDWVQETTFGTAGNVALGGAAGKFKDFVGNAKSRWFRFKLATGGSSGTLFAWVTVPHLSRGT